MHTIENTTLLGGGGNQNGCTKTSLHTVAGDDIGVHVVMRAWAINTS